MNWAARKRQEFVEHVIATRGTINRSDLMGEFGISSAYASIDLRKFREVNPGLIVYNDSTKRYERNDLADRKIVEE